MALCNLMRSFSPSSAPADWAQKVISTQHQTAEKTYHLMAAMTSHGIHQARLAGTQRRPWESVIEQVQAVAL